MASRPIISNYSVLHELWDWSLGIGTDIEIKAQIRGVGPIQVQMQQFEFCFGLVLCRDLLQHRPTDSLSVCFCKESRFLQLNVYPWLS